MKENIRKLARRWTCLAMAGIMTAATAVDHGKKQTESHAATSTQREGHRLVKFVDTELVHNNYRLTLDANGGTLWHPSGDVAMRHISSAVPEYILEEVPERVGYRFLSWNTMVDGSGEDFSVGSTIELKIGNENTTTLYAQWARTFTEVKLRIDYSGGTDKDGDTKIKVVVKSACTTYSLGAWSIKREGYRLAKFVDEDTGKSIYAPQGVFHLPVDDTRENINYQAVWEVKEEPTTEPTEAPTAEPTPEPTTAPTLEPTTVSTEAPTAEPTIAPTEAPIVEPTTVPTETPTAEPTKEPTPSPTVEPTTVPTEAPTLEPTTEPTEAPTAEPTKEPTPSPTAEPTIVPTTETPTLEPTTEPTEAPTAEPTKEPTPSPTAEPTIVPTEAPTLEPTTVPTEAPTLEATTEPTEAPTLEPTKEPTPVLTAEPTKVPTTVPTEAPTLEPTTVPTEAQTPEPTIAPIVTPKPTTSPISLKKATMVIGKGEKVAVPLKNGEGKKITYSSSDRKVATVTEKGIVKGVKAGTATIHIKADGKTCKLKIRVKKKPATVRISSVPNVKMGIGDKLFLQAILSTGSASYSIKWSSSDKKVVDINAKGVATIKGRGKATITVRTYNGKTAKLNLNIR